MALPAILRAQSVNSSEIILTWHANNFYPSDFLGKPLVTRNTNLTLAAEVIQNNKFLDTSRANFYWYADGKLIERGEGLKQISYTTSKKETDTEFIKVTVKNGKETYETSSKIPIAGYDLALEIPYPGYSVKSGSQIALKAVPYFFNIQSLLDLSFFWKINNIQESTQSANELAVNIGKSDLPGQTIEIEVRAVNQTSPLESVLERVQLFIY